MYEVTWNLFKIQRIYEYRCSFLCIWRYTGNGLERSRFPPCYSIQSDADVAHGESCNIRRRMLHNDPRQEVFDITGRNGT